MVKTNLPLIILRGIVLFPFSEIRIEISDEAEKKIVDSALNYQDGHVLLVNLENPLEMSPEVSDLPKIGIVGKIKEKIQVSNDTDKYIIVGINRVNIHNYLNFNNEENMKEGVIGPVNTYEIDPKEEMALSRILIKELEIFVSTIPYISNTVINATEGIFNLSKLTDLIASYLPVSYDRRIKYINTNHPIKRAKMLLEDMRREEEILELENKLDKELKVQLDKAQKEFIIREKIRVLKDEIKDVNIKEEDIEKIKEKISELNAPDKIIDRIMEELKRYEGYPSNSPEVGVVRNYIDWMINLPWDDCSEEFSDIAEIKNELDKSHYGLDKIKQHIIEYIASKKLCKNNSVPIICFLGPPGVGKTSLAKSIASALKKEFVKITVGGVSDEAELIGHRKTYLGASPGRIIQALKKTKVSNPLILIDEIDKMGKDFKGDPTNILLEILDPEQNKTFSDNYIEEEYDLSKIMFIATANYIRDIPEALRDRLEIIELSSYTEYEKLDIAKSYLIPNILKDYDIKNKITITDKTILYIINHYTREAGVRELNRIFKSIIRKIITDILVNNKPNHSYVVNHKNIKEYLDNEKYFYTNYIYKNKIGIVNGMAYTSYGGDVLPIEVNTYKGSGNLELTGNIGSVMKESAKIALSYLKSNYLHYKIDFNKLKETDIHIHIPEGAIPKEGPSAGIALTSAILSALTNMKVSNSIAMTGEITLRGNVLPIGGLREKIIGAIRANIKTIIIPFSNKSDLNMINSELTQNVDIILVKDYKEVYTAIKEHSN